MELIRASRVAGLSLVLMALAAFFAFGIVHGSLVVEGDARTTYENIAASGMLFKAEIIGWLAILLLDIIVAWALYIVLEPIQKSLALLGAWLRLVYAALLGVALLNLIHVSTLTNDAVVTKLLASGQLHAQTMLHLHAFESSWSVGLILFGAHLLVVGSVAYRSAAIPKVISVLLLLAGIGYLIVELSSILFPQFDGVHAVLLYVFILPMTAGELGFGLWLLFRGGKLAAAKA